MMVPEMTFNFYGYVSSWSALTVAEGRGFLSFFQVLIIGLHSLYIWRPNANKNYDLLGTRLVPFQNLQVDPIDNSIGLAPPFCSYFRFVNRLSNAGNLSFQQV